MSDSMRDEVYEGLFMMSRAGDVIRDTHGNLSGRDGSLFYIKPSGMEYHQISREDICEGSIWSGTFSSVRKPSVDAVHHMKIYEKHPWITGICHTHSPYATAHAIANSGIRCLSTEQADYFGGGIPVWAYVDLYSWGENLQIENRHGALLLQSHGCLTYSDRGPVHAVKLAIALENIAFKNFIAQQINKCSSLPNEEVKKWKERYDNVYGQ